MTAEERRARILELLDARDLVRVEELAERFGVSEVTIRKDLAVLEAEGQVRRVHGGAIRWPRARFNPSFEEKIHQRVEAKEAIATEALGRIEEHDALILDAGTTTLALARLLKNSFQNLFIITNSLPIALELSGSSFDLLLTGGTVRHHSGALIGPAAVATLEAYNADKVFLGATGVHLERGFTTPNPIEAETKSAMLKAASERYVLADASKLGKATLARFAKLEEVTELITDAEAPAPALERLRSKGLAVTVAKAVRQGRLKV